MLKKLINKINLWLNPPRPGSFYYGDPLYFVVGKPIEHVLHGLKDKNGEPIFYPIPSAGCYRLMIESIFDDYYCCKSEVLCYSLNMDSGIGKWMKRTQTKRINKVIFNEFIVQGILSKKV